MTGYDSYVSNFPQKPKYKRQVVYPSFDEPLNELLRNRGVLLETERIGSKILSAADGATTYHMVDGGVAEVMPDKYSGAKVLVIVPPDQMDAYRRYNAPLPFWAWSIG